MPPPAEGLAKTLPVMELPGRHRKPTEIAKTSPVMELPGRHRKPTELMKTTPSELAKTLPAEGARHAKTLPVVGARHARTPLALAKMLPADELAMSRRCPPWSSPRQDAAHRRSSPGRRLSLEHAKTPPTVEFAKTSSELPKTQPRNRQLRQLCLHSITHGDDEQDDVAA